MPRRGPHLPESSKPGPAAIGFRVKSGWAAAVLLEGPAASPHVLDRCQVDLSDPNVPQSRQPYHAGTGIAQTDAARIAQLARGVERYAKRSVADLVTRYRFAGHSLRGVAIVVGSNIDPTRFANPHIRAHAFEGRLFRTVVQNAVRQRGLPCTVVVERNIYAAASRLLRMSEERLKRAARELGRGVGGQWRAEEKTAAVAAWIVLANPRLRTVGLTRRTTRRASQEPTRRRGPTGG